MAFLGVEYPILQAGMGGVAGSALAAAVSNAGGLGILAGHGITPDELKAELEVLKRGTDRPFGVNLLLPADLFDPVEPAPTDADPVNEVLNPLRIEVGLEGRSGLPEAPGRNIPEKLEIILQARPRVLSIGMGNPGRGLVRRCHELDIRVIAMATTIEDALILQNSGVDAVVVQGAEAGGHRSHFVKPSDSFHGLVGSLVLIPGAADALRVPVIAAGGITDGRGLIAALALGAQAVMIGTRFIASRESLAVPAYKRAVIESRSSDTVITDSASGRYARLIRNQYTRDYGESPTLPFGWQGSAVSDLFDRARELNDRDHMALWAGQVAGRVTDERPAAEIIEQIMSEARAARADLPVFD